MTHTVHLPLLYKRFVKIFFASFVLHPFIQCRILFAILTKYLLDNFGLVDLFNKRCVPIKIFIRYKLFNKIILDLNVKVYNLSAADDM